MEHQIEKVISKRARSAQFPIQRQGGERDRPEQIRELAYSEERAGRDIGDLGIENDVKVVIQGERVHQGVAVSQHHRRQEQSDAKRFLHSPRAPENVTARERCGHAPPMLAPSSRTKITRKRRLWRGSGAPVSYPVTRAGKRLARIPRLAFQQSSLLPLLPPFADPVINGTCTTT